jgi:tRNA threonylcarbamoyladenosine biosynthesis protein TsaE
VTETVLELPSPEATAIFGVAIAKALKAGQVVFLEGELGAGKTTLVRAILSGLGWTGSVRSPSYALVHGYPDLAPAIHHLDLYRIGSMEEALGLDLDHLLDQGGTLLIEWADRLEDAIKPSFTIAMEITGTESRQARIRPGTDAYIGERLKFPAANCGEFSGQ